VIVGFIDDHRDELGVEPICRALQVVPSTYYAAKRRQVAPSARAVRDAVMMQVLMLLWVSNRKVYGAHKLWKAARRAGHDIGRDQVARLMRELGIQGVSRCRKRIFTTVSDLTATRAPDLVNRHFRAERPNALWVTDLTHVPTRSGMAYVALSSMRSAAESSAGGLAWWSSVERLVRCVRLFATSPAGIQTAGSGSGRGGGVHDVMPPVRLARWWARRAWSAARTWGSVRVSRRGFSALT
jgi:hypothetical protein